MQHFFLRICFKLTLRKLRVKQTDIWSRRTCYARSEPYCRPVAGRARISFTRFVLGRVELHIRFCYYDVIREIVLWHVMTDKSKECIYVRPSLYRDEPRKLSSWKEAKARAEKKWMDAFSPWKGLRCFFVILLAALPLNLHSISGETVRLCKTENLIK